jgi:predicted DCC family thiol-disulfide oxidoreductase YuxK
MNAHEVPTATAGDLLFDGDCAFCSASAGVLRGWVPTSAQIRAWQFVDVVALGLTAEQCDQAVQWVAAGRSGPGEVATGALAIAALLRTSTQRRWRLLGGLLALGPVQVLARPAYGWVARHRHQLPGGTAACALPSPGPGKVSGAGS